MAMIMALVTKDMPKIGRVRVGKMGVMFQEKILKPCLKG
jgi:hypothetical protein